MTGTGTKVLLLIFFIHAFIYIGESTMDLGTPSNHTITKTFLEDYGKLTINQTGNETEVISGSQSMGDYNLSEGGGISGGYSSYFNPVGAAWSALGFLAGVISSPLTLYSLPIPWQFKLIFFGPLGILYLIAIISFIRGGDF